MKIAIATPYSIIDSTSGASVATLHALASLSGPIVTTHAFCSTHVDSPNELLPEEWLAESRLSYEVTRNSHFSMIHTESHGVRIDMFRTESTCRRWTGPDEITRFLAAFDCFLEAFRPDVLITYGGDNVSLAMMRMINARGTPIVFYLHNFAYSDLSTFESVDRVLVPSEFSRRYYREKIGLDCHAISNILDFERMQVVDPRPKYVTLVNPQPSKGLSWFIGIARELAERRPDIPLLAVEGRTRIKELGALPNVTTI